MNDTRSLKSIDFGKFSERKISFWVAIVAAIVFISVTVICAQIQFEGNLYWQFMPSEAFGQPQEIKERTGVWFKTDKVGWDGQFYFHMANDPFIQKDTSQHLDDPAYRYRRIGLALWSYALSKLGFQDWVSPELYLLSHLLFLLCGIWILSRFLQKNGLSPWWISCWALSIGTLSSFVHGLPDPMGDVGMMAGFVSYISGYGVLTSFFFLFAGLARENTILVPIFLLLFELWKMKEEIVSSKGLVLFQRMKRFLPLLLPVLFVTLWHLYVLAKLGPVTPWIVSLVLDWPLKQFFLKFFQKNDHWGLAVLLFSILPIIWMLKEQKEKRMKVFWAVLFLSFSTGPIVWDYYRDLLKNFNYLLLLALIIFVHLKSEQHKRSKIILIVSFALHFSSFLKLKNQEYFGLPRYCEACKDNGVSQKSHH